MAGAVACALASLAAVGTASASSSPRVGTILPSVDATSTTTASNPATDVATTLPRVPTPPVDPALVKMLDLVDRDVHFLDNDLILIPLKAIGYGENVRMSGEFASRGVSVPIPAGVKPIAFIGRVGVSADAQGGFLETAIEGEPTFSLDLLVPARNDELVPISVPLDKAVVRSNRLSVEVKTRLHSYDDACNSSLLGAWTEIRDGALLVQGRPTKPQTVASFLPELLKTLRIVVPDHPTSAEATVALELAAAATRRTSGGRVAIEITTVAKAAATEFAPLARTVTIDERAPAELQLVDGVAGDVNLSVGGTPEDLARSGKLLASKLAPLAVGSIVSANEITDPVSVTPGHSTLADLNQGNLLISGVGRLEMPIYLNQSTFGGPISRAVIHLDIAYTPLADGGRASLQVLVNGIMQEAQDLGKTGKTVVDVNLDAETLQRDIGMAIRVDYTPPGQRCSPGLFPFTYQIKPTSTIDVSRGQSLDATFERFPQVLVEDFPVAIDVLDPDRLTLAVGLVTALQRQAGVPLHPRVITVSDVKDVQGAAVVISANTPALKELAPPFLAAPLKAVDQRRGQKLDLGIDDPFAVLTAYSLSDLAGTASTTAAATGATTAPIRNADQDRLLLTWNKNPKYAHDLVESINTPTQNWASLSGDTYVEAIGTPPLNLRLRSDPTAAAPGELPITHTLRGKAIQIAAIGLVFMIVFFVMLQRRSRRRRKQMELDIRASIAAEKVKPA